MEVSIPNALRPTANRLVRRARLLLTPISLILFLVLWEVLARSAKLPAFILPTPGRVFDRFLQAAGDGTLLRHAMATLLDVVLGFVAGTLLATFTGSWIAGSRRFQKLFA